MPVCYPGTKFAQDKWEKKAMEKLKAAGLETGKIWG